MKLDREDYCPRGYRLYVITCHLKNIHVTQFLYGKPDVAVDLIP